MCLVPLRVKLQAAWSERPRRLRFELSFEGVQSLVGLSFAQYAVTQPQFVSCIDLRADSCCHEPSVCASSK